MAVYMKYLYGHELPKVSDLFIDYLTMTVDYPPSEHKKIVDGFKQAEDVGNGKKIYTASYYYTLKLNMDVPEEGSVIIQCSPKDTTYRFFRIEFNPAKTNLANLKKDMDAILPGGYDKMMSAGIVTRLDLTCDIEHLNINEILPKYPKMPTKLHYAKNGLIETMYLGAFGSSKQFVFYDKTAEIVKTNKKKYAWFKTAVPPYDLLRVECRLTSLNCTLKHTLDLKNPFYMLSLPAYFKPKVVTSYEPLWDFFLASCRHERMDIALSRLNGQDKERYQKMLQTQKLTFWWRPKDLWKGLPDAIKKITDVNGYSTTQALIA